MEQKNLSTAGGDGPRNAQFPTEFVPQSRGLKLDHHNRNRETLRLGFNNFSGLDVHRSHKTDSTPLPLRRKLAPTSSYFAGSFL